MQKDYIMRIVEHFVQAILSIMRCRKTEDYKEARELVRTTGRYLLRMDIDLLLLYDHDQILEHFKDFSNCFETEKCILSADLFYELALIEEAEKQPAVALRLKMLCLHLYTLALPKEPQFQEARYFEKVAALIEELKDQPLSEPILASLRCYEEFLATKHRLTEPSMLTAPPTEYVYQMPDQENYRALQEHFKSFYRILVEGKLVPNAAFESVEGIERCLSGIPSPYNNVVMGYPRNAAEWDACIEEQLSYFNEAKMPFVWYINEGAGEEFKKKLIDRGFQDVGIFRGVTGSLDKPISLSEIPDDCVLELVQDEASMDEFNDLVCATFGMTGISKDLYRKFLWAATNKTDQPVMCHWVARKQGKVVSAVSTMIQGDMVSFWNGASVPEVRKQGLSTALRRVALQDAVSKGCHVGSSYLMAEGLAFGICSKLGYQTKWRFNVFLAPAGGS